MHRARRGVTGVGAMFLGRRYVSGVKDMSLVGRHVSRVGGMSLGWGGRLVSEVGGRHVAGAHSATTEASLLVFQSLFPD